MYILLGLLWLSFKIIQGEIIQCPIGGLTNTAQCEKLTEESVFQRFFINEGQTSMHKKFKSALILDENIPIKYRWKQALKKGTDTYRIKFHTKLANQYKHINKSLPNEEWMVLIQSFYAAASTYYFSKNCDLANTVIDEGLIFFGIVTKDNQGKHVRVWSVVLQTLKIDILICMNQDHDNKKLEIMNNVSKEEEQFDDLNYGSFPSSAVLLFRGYFLNNHIDNQKKKKFESWLENVKLWDEKTINDDILDWDYMSMYKFLVLFYSTSDNRNKILNIYKAVERPVLSTEDRLLNYKATELALGVYTSCLEINKPAICTTFSDSENIYQKLESKIIPKLKILNNLKNSDLNNVINEKTPLCDDIIDEDLLHLIVTSALNIDSEIYQSNIKKVECAIQLLDDYVNTLTDKKSSEELMKENIIEKRFIVYKWLMEMNGLLINNSKDEQYREKFSKALNKANELSNKLLHFCYKIEFDDHFKYLKAKYNHKFLLRPYDWEVSTRPGGWVPSDFQQKISKFKNIVLFNDNKTSLFDVLLSIQSFKYINKIELKTLEFRYKKSSNNFVDMYDYIIKAITEIVITPEDRLRNLEAHELLTVFLMDQNTSIAKNLTKNNKINIGEYYKFFDPEIYKDISEIKSEEEKDEENYWSAFHHPK